MIQKLRLFIILLLITIQAITSIAFANDELNNIVAEGAIIINGDTGQVIYAKNAHLPLFPASTTKILTAIIIIENHDLDEVVEICNEAPYAGGSHIALEPGERVTVEQLLYALMITSANDAAVSLAKHHAGSVEAFAEIMNAYALDKGALNSFFKNPHGMPDNEHISTAYDLAMIAKHAMTSPTFRTISQTRRYEIPPTNRKTETRYLNSTNALFPGISGSNAQITLNGSQTLIGYDLATGIKRGYTNAAQFCFVGSASFEGRNVITAVLKSQDRLMYQDTRLLMNYAFSGTESHLVNTSQDVMTSIPLNNKRQTIVQAVVPTDVRIDLPVGLSPDDIEVKEHIFSNIELPLSENEEIGSIGYYHNDVLLLQVPLVSDSDYIGENLLNAETYHFMEKKPLYLTYQFWLSTFVRLMFALVVWRSIITLIRVFKIRARAYKKRAY